GENPVVAAGQQRPVTVLACWLANRRGQRPWESTTSCWSATPAARARRDRARRWPRPRPRRRRRLLRLAWRHAPPCLADATTRRRHLRSPPRGSLTSGP